MLMKSLLLCVLLYIDLRLFSLHMSLSRFLWHEVTRSISTSPLDGMLVHRRVTPSIFTGTHLYTWVERGTVRVKCLSQEHNTMSPARARTGSARSGVEYTNHEATAPPIDGIKCQRSTLQSKISIFQNGCRI